MLKERKINVQIGKQKFLAIILSISMVLSIIPLISITAFAGTLPGARSETNSYGDVFLGGNYIDVGVSQHGSFGTKGNAPSGFHHGAKANLGLCVDGDGWDIGNNRTTGDFFLPGTEEERWMLGYTYNGQSYEFYAADRRGDISPNWSIAPTASNTSDIAKNILSATVTGTTVHGIKITLVYSFGVNDRYFTTKVKIENTSSYNVTNVRFLRSFDPDQDADLNGSYKTYNKVACNPRSTDNITTGGDNNFAMVVAKGEKTLEGFFFIAFDERARGSILDGLVPSSIYGNDTNGNPIWCDSNNIPTSADSNRIAGTSGYVLQDTGIALTFNLGTILASKNDNLTYYSSLDPNVTESLATIKKAAAGSIDYANDQLSSLEPNSKYTIEYTNDSGTKTKIIVTADSSGNVPLVGTGSLASGGSIAYDLAGKVLTITPIVGANEEAVSQEITISGRPSTPDAPTVNDTLAASTPESVTVDQIETTVNTIKVASPVSGQEYSINNGASWLKYTGTENILFPGLAENTQYIVITRISATDESPASLPSSGVNVKTQVMLKNMSISATGYDGIYDGKNHSISVSIPGVTGASIEYSSSLDSGYSSLNPQYKNVGSYTVYYRITKTGFYPAYGSKTISIGQATPSAFASGSAIDYGNKLSESVLNASAFWGEGEVAGTFSWVNGNTIYPAVADSNSTLYTVLFTPTDTTNYKSVEKKIKITVNMASQSQPLTVDNVDETISKKSDGKITGVTDKMEYCKVGGTYTSVPENATEITMLPSGTYYVRFKGDANHLASPVSTIKINPGRKLNVVIPENQVGYALTASKITADWNEVVTLNFNVNTGYTESDNPTVTSNNLPISFANGKYEITMQQDATIKVNGIKDITPPTGKITVESKWWKEFLNTISFGTLFNKNVNISIDGEDTGSGIKSIEYIKSDKQLTLSQVKAITTWNQYTNAIVLTPTDANQSVYYVKLTDKALNETYISSDGFTFDVTKPSVSGITNDAQYYTTQKAIVTDKNTTTITVNDIVKASPIILAGNVNTTYIIKAIDAAGNESSITITMKPISSLYSSINSVTLENVKSSDKKNILDVKDSLTGIDSTYATVAEKQEINDEIDKCNSLLSKIATTASESKRISDSVDTFDTSTVKSYNTKELEKLITDINAQVNTNNLTEEEISELKINEIKATKLLMKLAEAKSHVESKEVVAAKSITFSSVKMDDKNALIKAHESLSTALSEANGNYTDKEKEEINAQIITIKQTLKTIENVESFNTLVLSLPEFKQVRLSHAEIIMSAKASYDALSVYEKRLVSAEYVEKLNQSVVELEKISNTDVPNTGNNSYIFLLATLFVSSASLIAAFEIVRKRKENMR